jgi:hypothetical protein
VGSSVPRLPEMIKLAMSILLQTSCRQLLG